MQQEETFSRVRLFRESSEHGRRDDQGDRDFKISVTTFALGALRNLLSVSRHGTTVTFKDNYKLGR